MLSAKQVVEKVNQSGRNFSKGTFNRYNRLNLLPKKKSAATKEGKLVWLYPERTLEIIEKIIDERNKGANLDYIATFLWLDIAFAEMSDKELSAIKEYLGDYELYDKDKRGRLLCALASGFEFMEELRKAHLSEDRLFRLYWLMWQGVKNLIRYHQGKISKEEYERRASNPELNEETIELAEKLISVWKKQETKEQAA